MFKKETEPTAIDLEITAAYRKLEGQDFASKEYKETLSVISILQEMKKQETSPSFSKDTVLVVAGNLLGILLILNYERLHVVSRGAMSLLPRTR